MAQSQPGIAGGHDGSGCQFGGGVQPAGTGHPGGGLNLAAMGIAPFLSAGMPAELLMLASLTGSRIVRLPGIHGASLGDYPDFPPRAKPGFFMLVRGRPQWGAAFWLVAPS